MPMNQPITETATLEERVLDALRAVTTGDNDPDIVTSGQVYAVVATGDAIRVLLDTGRIPSGAEEALAELITPYVEAIPGVERVVVKPRPRSIARREKMPGIGQVIGIHSGKGGVGKSTITVNLAVALARLGYRIGVLDADVYGPSCPALLGIHQRAELNEMGNRIEAVERHGVRLMSLGMLLPEGQALIWRGSLVDQGVAQLIDDVAWGELDLLLVDLPPGTSDVHLAVAQHASLSGVVTVTAPGQISVDDVRRGLEMFADLQVPCLGLIQNMDGVVCAHCGEEGPLFGASGGEQLAEETGIPLLASLPFDQQLAVQSDLGEPVALDDRHTVMSSRFSSLADTIASRICLNNPILRATS